MTQADLQHTEADGEIYKVTGPVVVATGMNPQMYDVVHVGQEGLMGENDRRKTGGTCREHRRTTFSRPGSRPTYVNI
jgi:hypothetical protein